MSSLKPYTHHNLSTPRSIRVLELKSATDIQDEIQCILKEVSLDDEPHPRYYALSYCWEAQIPDASIRCGGDETLKITQNCAAALRALREPHESVTLWIDSICIDQSSLSERSVQVALMGEIYKIADKVIVWLGEWDAPLRKAVDVIKDIGYDPQDKAQIAMNPQDVQREMHAKAEALKQSIKTRDEDPLVPFFARSYWSRMWTIQETSVAQGQNVVIYGGPDPSSQLLWLALISAVDALQARNYSMVNLSKFIKLQKYLTINILLKRYPELQAIYDKKPGDRQRKAILWDILIGIREKEASDIKDKVFALYGILQELGLAIPAPDYTKPVEEIFREATAACINADQLLYVLYEVPSDHRHLRPSLSSWVPDWSDPGWRQTLSSDSRLAVTRDRFCASGPASPVWRFSPEGTQLLLRGKTLESIIYCGPPLCFKEPEAFAGKLDTIKAELKVKSTHTSSSSSPQGTGALEDYTAYVSEVYRTLKSWVDTSTWNESYPTGETTAQALSRTLVQDSPNTMDSRKHFDSWYNKMLQPEFETKDSEQGPTAALARFATSLPSNPYHSMAMTFSSWKTFFITENGYMGLAPAVLKNGVLESIIAPDDQIAVIAGLEMPFVLRPVNSHADYQKETVGEVFRLITHTYLHGIMYGEAWEDEGYKLQEIVLM